MFMVNLEDVLSYLERLSGAVQYTSILVPSFFFIAFIGSIYHAVNVYKDGNKREFAFALVAVLGIASMVCFMDHMAKYNGNYQRCKVLDERLTPILNNELKIKYDTISLSRIDKIMSVFKDCEVYGYYRTITPVYKKIPSKPKRSKKKVVVNE